jgi:hypothetical protein
MIISKKTPFRPQWRNLYGNMALSNYSFSRCVYFAAASYTPVEMLSVTCRDEAVRKEQTPYTNR